MKNFVVHELKEPEILYFAKTDKGIASRLFQTGKFVFPDRNSNIKPGFAKVTKLYHKENYCFAEGFNVESAPLTEELVKELFLESPEHGFAIREYRTSEDVSVMIMHSRLTDYVLFVEDGTVRRFLRKFLEETYAYHPNHLWERQRECFEDFILKLKQKYLLYPLTRFPLNVVSSQLSEWLEKNPQLKAFEEVMKKNVVSFLDLSDRYKIGPKGIFREYFYPNFLAYCPLTVNDNYYLLLSEGRKLLEQIFEYNLNILRWWKTEGLNKIEDPNYRFAVESELNKTPYWSEV